MPKDISFLQFFYATISPYDDWVSAKDIENVLV